MTRNEILSCLTRFYCAFVEWRDKYFAICKESISMKGKVSETSLEEPTSLLHPNYLINLWQQDTAPLKNGTLEINNSLNNKFKIIQAWLTHFKSPYLYFLSTLIGITDNPKYWEHYSVVVNMVQRKTIMRNQNQISLQSMHVDI